MTPAEVLRAARALIATPERWTRSTYMRDSAGLRLDIRCADDRARAVCWCSLGATAQVASDCDYGASDCDYGAEVKADRLLEAAVGGDVVRWNDRPGRTHAEVLAAFDRAIALAEAL